MRWTLILLGAFGLTLAIYCRVHAQNPEGDEPAPAAPETKLWGGISTNAPLFTEGDTGKLNLIFTVFNEGDTTIDPKIGEATLVINGKDDLGSWMMFNNGPRDNRFTALPPGDYLLFNYGVGNLFAKPGLYRVYWKTPVLRSDEIDIRILPKVEPKP